jgi:hypothetical protein
MFATTAKTPMGMHDQNTLSFPKRASNLVKGGGSPMFSRVDLEDLNTGEHKPSLQFKGFAQARRDHLQTKAETLKHIDLKQNRKLIKNSLVLNTLGTANRLSMSVDITGGG